MSDRARLSRRDLLKQAGLAGAAAVTGVGRAGRADRTARRRRRPGRDRDLAGQRRARSASPLRRVSGATRCVRRRTTGRSSNAPGRRRQLRFSSAGGGDRPFLRFGPAISSSTSSPDALTIDIRTARRRARPAPRRFDKDTGAITFALGGGPVLGLGEGGPQFDRRGATDRARNGQGGYQLRTHGGRVPVQWLVGTGGWAMFLHRPYCAFTLTDRPKGAPSRSTRGAPLPLELFVVSSNDGPTLMREYAALTGYPEMPPLWSLGYQQSHRTLASREEVLEEARDVPREEAAMRRADLPRHRLLPLGLEHRQRRVHVQQQGVPRSRGAMIAQLHDDHFKVVLHVVLEGHRLTGTVDDPCTAPPLPSGRTADGRWPEDRQVSCYWPAHKPVFDLGVDGWWPDQGDGLDAPSRLARNRMYFDGCREWRPDERPYALHRNGCAGMQRYASFLWSGDVYSTWETLKTHVPGRDQHRPLGPALLGHRHRRLRADQGTDRRALRALVPVRRVLPALPRARPHVEAAAAVGMEHRRARAGRSRRTTPAAPRIRIRASCTTRPSSRSAARISSCAISSCRTSTASFARDTSPGCRSSARSGCTTRTIRRRRRAATSISGGATSWSRRSSKRARRRGGSICRAARGTTSGRTTAIEGGREIDRAVDLETMPLYVRAGAIVPLGPVKQYTAEAVDAPTTLRIYPGADGAFLLYDDDGKSFAYQRGDWMGIACRWDATPHVEARAGGRLAMAAAGADAANRNRWQPGRPRRDVQGAARPIQLRPHAVAVTRQSPARVEHSRTFR